MGTNVPHRTGRGKCFAGDFDEFAGAPEVRVHLCGGCAGQPPAAVLTNVQQLDAAHVLVGVAQQHVDELSGAEDVVVEKTADSQCAK